MSLKSSPRKSRYIPFLNERTPLGNLLDSMTTPEQSRKNISSVISSQPRGLNVDDHMAQDRTHSPIP